MSSLQERRFDGMTPVWSIEPGSADYEPDETERYLAQLVEVTNRPVFMLDGEAARLPRNRQVH